MIAGRLVVHGHFYQPLRADPFSGVLPDDPTAVPYRNWNERVEADCYGPNVERGNLARMSFDLGPTLAAWLQVAAPATYAGFVAAGVTSIAQAFHHTILPLASAADRRTEIRWGLRDHEFRFGRPAEGLWLPETAVDLPTLRLLADEGVGFTILAPWQAAEPGIETRRPFRVELGGGRSIVVALYDGALSAAVSFEPSATADADRFVAERVAPRLAGGAFPDDEPPLVVIATDGELYGHHQPFREMFLQRLLAPGLADPPRDFEVVRLAEALREPEGRPFHAVRIAEGTSWSCHHGVLRWSGDCPDAADGRWKAPLRAALDRLAGGIDVATDALAAALPGQPDPWSARDAYVDVVLGGIEPGFFAADRIGHGASEGDRRAFLDLMEAQRWRLAMFASDGWYWDDPIRPETRQNLRSAARAVRLLPPAAARRLEARFVEDLALLHSPGTGADGAAIYRSALREVGQPDPAD